MKPIVLSGFDDERTKIPFTVPVKGRKPATVLVPRFDYIDEATFDAIMADLEVLDAQQQVIAAANELAGLQPGSELVYDPLIDAAKKQLTDCGVDVVRTVKQGRSQDVLCAPTEDVIAALAPFSSQTPMPLRKRSREIALTMLKYVVDEQELKWFADLPTGALDDLLTAWKTASTVSLGESEASSSS